MIVRALALLTCSALGAAHAHAELISSSPAAGATLTEPPAEVVLTFSESVTLDFSLFKVYPLPVEAAQASLEVGAAHAGATETLSLIHI